MSGRAGAAAGGLPAAMRNLPLPEPHLALLATGLVLQLIRPLPLPLRRTRSITLAAAATAGTALVAIGWATRAAGAVDLADPDQLVTRGPFGLTRHPMYEAWTALYAALAIMLRNGWLAALTPALLVMVHRDTSREDARMREQFGALHTEYARNVPRYLTVWLARIPGARLTARRIARHRHSRPSGHSECPEGTGVRPW